MEVVVNKRVKNYLIDALIIIPILLIIVFSFKACVHADDKIKAQLEPYRGVRLSESYDEVIKIMDDSFYTYEFCYCDRTLKIEPEYLEDEEWLSEHEITSFSVGNKHIRFSVDNFGMKSYKETLSDINKKHKNI